MATQRTNEREDSSTPPTGYGPQRWSEERPAAAGRWRWKGAQRDGKYWVFEVRERNGELWVIANDRWKRLKKLKCGGWWSGPLPEPLDAPIGETGHTDQDQQRAERARSQHE
jgi:hypothetical protein